MMTMAQDDDDDDDDVDQDDDNSNLFVECSLSKNIFEQPQVWFVQHTTMSSMAYCCFACNELPLFDVHVHMFWNIYSTG